MKYVGILTLVVASAGLLGASSGNSSQKRITESASVLTARV